MLLTIKNDTRFLLVIMTIYLTSCSSKTVQQLIDDGFLEDGKKAIRLYSKAISKDKNNVEAYWRRGHEYYKMKQYNDAIANFNKAISIDSAFNSGYLFGDRGLCKEASNNYSGAIEDYTVALKLCIRKEFEPSTPKEDFYFYRARTRLKNGDTALAVSDVDCALYYWSSFPKARFMKGRLLVMQGQYNEAVQYFKGLLDPSFAEDKEFIDDVFYYAF